MELQKANNTLDHDICLEILAVYGVVPRALQIIQTYCGQLTMVAKARGYYASPPSRTTVV